MHVVPKTEKNEFGEVDTERTWLQLDGTMYPLEVVSSAPLSFRYAGSEASVVVYLDQPEELGDVRDAYFLPLVQIEHHLSDASTMEPTAPTLLIAW